MKRRSVAAIHYPPNNYTYLEIRIASMRQLTTTESYILNQWLAQW